MAPRAEIDPLAVIFPTKVFLILMEIKHPRVDRAAIRRAIKGLSASELRDAKKRVSELEAMTAAVKEELASAQ